MYIQKVLQFFLSKIFNVPIAIHTNSSLQEIFLNLVFQLVYERN